METALLHPDDSLWRDCIANLPHDVYHSPEYLRFASRYEAGTPCAFYVRHASGCCLIPLLIRDLPNKLHAPPTWQDATSPYGYASPLIEPTDPHHLRVCFDAFIKAARGLGLISVFLRFNPLLDLPMTALAPYGEIVDHGPTVVIDLACPVEEFRSRMRKAYLRQIARMKRMGFRTVMDDWQYYDDFIRLYGTTMERVGAGDFYLFDNEYFWDMKSELGPRLHLCTVLAADGRVAAAGLFTSDASIIQYHLSGTADEYLPLAPTKLMLYAVRFWGAESGARWFHLGGGRGGKVDSLFNFKKGFSDLHKRFYTLRMITDQEKYLQLIPPGDDNGLSKDDSGFFPAYRAD